MKRFVAGLALGLALMALAGIAYASIPDAGGVVHTCYGPGNTWRPIDFPTEQCKSNETALNLNQSGPQGVPGPKGDKGDPGTFNGTFTSPNGLYSISVTDAGIQLSGPGATIGLSTSAVTVNSSGSVTVGGTASVSITSSGTVSAVSAGAARLGGSTVSLCPSGSGLPVARATDPVSVPAPPNGIISSGSLSVTAC